MSDFWISCETMKEIAPDYVFFKLFGPLHLAVTAIFILIIVVGMYFYKKLDDGGRQKFLNVLTVLLVLNEVSKHIILLATGQWGVEQIPLHLCRINIFVCLWHTIKRDEISAEILYAVCAPGALIALLMPTWNNLPLWNAISMNSNSVHVFLLMYPLLLIAGGFRPSVKRLPKVSLVLICEAVPIFFINKLLDTNFFYINGTENNPLLIFLAGIFGEELYILGLPVILAFVWAAMYLPWYLAEKKEQKTQKV